MASLTEAEEMNEIPRTEMTLEQLETVLLPQGISRALFASVATVMITVNEDEGKYHGGISAILSAPSDLDTKTTPCRKPSGPVKGFVAEKHSYMRVDEGVCMGLPNQP